MESENPSTGMLKEENRAENKKITQKFLLFIRLIRNNKTVSLIFRLIITVLFFAIVNKSVDFAQIGNLFEHVSILQLSIASVLGFAGLYFQVLRWKEILHSQKFPSTLTIAAKTFFIGHLLAFVTPGRLGELMRAWKLSDDKKHSSVISVIIDRFYSIIMVLFFGILSIAIHLVRFKTANVNKLWFLIAFSVIILALILVLFKHYQKILVHFKKGFIGVIAKNIDELHSIKPVKILFYSAAAYVILIIQTAVVIDIFDQSNFGINLLIASETYLFMLFFPFFIANIGLREYSFMFFLTEFSSHANSSIPSIAFGISTLILLINIVFPAFVGLVWGAGERIRIKN